jgi:hypothetical protein
MRPGTRRLVELVNMRDEVSHTERMWIRLSVDMKTSTMWSPHSINRIFAG